MAVKKQILDRALLEEDFFDGAALIGIASPLPPSRLCHALNCAFGFRLVREPEQDLCMHLKGQDGLRRYFPVFQETIEAEALELTLYRLKAGPDTLLPEIPHLDYLWLVRTNTSGQDAEAFVQLLRRIPDILMAQVIEVEQLTHAANLII